MCINMLSMFNSLNWCDEDWHICWSTLPYNPYITDVEFSLFILIGGDKPYEWINIPKWKFNNNSQPWVKELLCILSYWHGLSSHLRSVIVVFFFSCYSVFFIMLLLSHSLAVMTIVLTQYAGIFWHAFAVLTILTCVGSYLWLFLQIDSIYIHINSVLPT